jgi:CheY-like chemotaxis protein
MRALRLLLAEDDTLLGILLGEMLEGLGHDVCAIEAVEADVVASALRCRPDLMIVDAGLGDGSGVSAVAEILRSGPVPHLFISGDIAKVKERRPDAVMLQKPFREPDLIRAMQRALGAGAAAA